MERLAVYDALVLPHQAVAAGRMGSVAAARRMIQDLEEQIQGAVAQQQEGLGDSLATHIGDMARRESWTDFTGR